MLKRLQFKYGYNIIVAYDKIKLLFFSLQVFHYKSAMANKLIFVFISFFQNHIGHIIFMDMLNSILDVDCTARTDLKGNYNMIHIHVVFYLFSVNFSFGHFIYPFWVVAIIFPMLRRCGELLKSHILSSYHTFWKDDIKTNNMLHIRIFF